MARFAFYGRVSTEDQQDPTASRGWQLQRASQLLGDADSITAEFFDVGQSRSLPWKRRPESAALLEAIKDPHRGFAAVVIGEPARAFYGNQFGLTFPVFVHYGVELWVPEVGGRVDPGSDAHDLVMSLYGGMSKGERNRIKVRVRSAMSDQAQREGRFLGGRPPYGYLLGDAGPHPNPSKAAIGQRLRRLERDDTAAPIVARIYAEYLAGAGLYAIAEGLTRDRVPSPSAHDPRATATARARRGPRAPCGRSSRTRGTRAGRSGTVSVATRSSSTSTTSRSAMRPSFAGTTRPTGSGRPTRPTRLSSAPTTTSECKSTWRLAGTAPQSGRPDPRRGRTSCAGCSCAGSAAAAWAASTTTTRPTTAAGTPPSTPLTNNVDHPRTVYLREADVVPELDAWLARIFDPEHLDDTCAELAAASIAGAVDDAALEAAHRKLEDCDTRLDRYRLALESGTDPAIVGQWIREVQGDRLRAEQALASAARDELGVDQVRAVIEGLGPITSVLDKAKPAKKAELYASLGLQLTYRPAQNLVAVEAAPVACAKVRVGGGT